MALPHLILAAVAVGVALCVLSWVRFCVVEARRDAPVEARAAALAAAEEARALIRAMRADHNAHITESLRRWAAEPDTAELTTPGRWSS